MTLPQLKPLPQTIPEQLARAESLRAKGELDEAMRVAVAYLNDNYDDVSALTLAAHIFIDADRLGLAHPILRRACQLAPNMSVLWNNLGLCYQEGSDLAEGEACFHRAIKLDSESPYAYNNLAQMYVNMAQPTLAIKNADRAIALDKTFSDAHFNRGLAQLQLGNWKDGWPGYDANLGVSKTRKERKYGPIPRFNGEKGKTVVAYGEQGIGDEISFASCIPDLMKDNKVIIECDPRLQGLFKRSFGVETHGTRFQAGLDWPANQRIDASVAFGSLPRYYRNDPKDFPGTPYLKADPQRRLQWRALLDSLGDKPKVGIAWTGGLKNTGRDRRSLDLDDLLPILRQDATFISLQYKDAPEVDELELVHGIKVHHWKHAVQTDDYDDTAALVAELDLVISVTSGVIHLCGALGKKCWVLTPKAPMWRYGLFGDKMPWYDSVKLYRQTGKWVDVIAQVATDLRNL